MPRKKKENGNHEQKINGRISTLNDHHPHNFTSQFTELFVVVSLLMANLIANLIQSLLGMVYVRPPFEVVLYKIIDMQKTQQPLEIR